MGVEEGHQGVHLYPLGEVVVEGEVVGHQQGVGEVVEGQMEEEAVEQRRVVGVGLQMEEEGLSLGPLGLVL